MNNAWYQRVAANMIEERDFQMSNARTARRLMQHGSRLGDIHHVRHFVKLARSANRSAVNAQRKAASVR